MPSPSEYLTCCWCGDTSPDVQPFEGPYSKYGPRPFCTDSKACMARGRAADHKHGRGALA